MNEDFCFNNSSFVKFDNGIYAAFSENEKEAIIRINIDYITSN